MCLKAIDDCLAISKFFPNWFVTCKMLDKLDNVLQANVALFYNEDFDKVTFVAGELDKIDLANDNNFDEDGPDTIVYVRLFAWHSKFKKSKAL